MADTNDGSQRCVAGSTRTMRALPLYVVAVVWCSLSFALPVESGGADQNPVAIVTVRDAGGKLRSYFEPRPEPFRAGMKPITTILLSDRRDVRDSEGRIVSGFGFYCWRDSSEIHVQVLVFIPKPGAPNRYLANDFAELQSLTRTSPFASYSLKMEVPTPIVEMRVLGLEPMRLTLEPRVPVK